MDAHAVQPLNLGRALGWQPDRFDDLLDESTDQGHGHVRFDVPWAVAEPRQGVLDGSVFETLLAAGQRARSAGLQMWCRLLQPDVPRWFDDEGGFGDDRVARLRWPRWVETVADRLGDHVDGWVPIEAPFGAVLRLAPGDERRQGEIMHRLVIAWRDAWRILHGVHPVATSLDVAVERPDDDTAPAADEARRRDLMRWDTWGNGLRHGIVTIPGRPDIRLDDLAGSADVIGIALRADGRTTADLDSTLERLVDLRLGRPLAITVRPAGEGRDERQESIGRFRERLDALAAETGVTRLTVVG